MDFSQHTSPHISGSNQVSKVMLEVLIAMIPGIMAMGWYFGSGVIYNLVIAVVTALAAEAVMLRLRDRPIKPHLLDLSAVVTAVLIALSLPPLLPWWVTVIGTAFAIVVGKHLYGGLGFNPFNPAMVGYVLLLITFPVEMTIWLPTYFMQTYTLGPLDTAAYVFFGQLPTGITIDALAGATPLDEMKTQLAQNITISEIRSSPLWGDFGGQGWEWIGNWFGLGGLWLVYRKIITWHIPVAVLGSLLAIAMVFYLIDSDSHPFALFHVFSGGAILCAFFIATDPVSAATSNLGKIYFGIGIGLLIYIIRSWGGYPDGVAFAVLLMNMAAPMIDYYTKPKAFGHHGRSS